MSAEESEKNAEANQKKVEEFIRKMKSSGGKVPPREEPSQPSADEGGESQNTFNPEERWQAWKRIHGSRLHDMEENQARTEADRSDYKVLGLSANATQEEVKKAFLQLAKATHPDQGGDPEKFMKLRAAYNRIMDEFKKG